MNIAVGSPSTSSPGKRADLVLLSTDPLGDIHNTTQIQAVWLRGKCLDRAALDQLLAAAKHRHGKSKLDEPLKILRMFPSNTIRAPATSTKTAGIC